MNYSFAFFCQPANIIHFFLISLDIILLWCLLLIYHSFSAEEIFILGIDLLLLSIRFHFWSIFSFIQFYECFFLFNSYWMLKNDPNCISISWRYFTILILLDHERTIAKHIYLFKVILRIRIQNDKYRLFMCVCVCVCKEPNGKEQLKRIGIQKVKEFWFLMRKTFPCLFFLSSFWSNNKKPNTFKYNQVDSG